jgi:hypothetical protein
VARASAAPASESKASWSQAAKRDATRMYDAYRRNDLVTVLGFTYPGLLRLMGGRAQMLIVLEQGAAAMKDQGYRFRTAKVGEPLQIVTAGRELHAVLPLGQVLEAPGGELHVDGYLIGISSDKGKTWTFVEAGKIDATKARQMFPAYNPELRIPSSPEPKLVKP